MALAAPRPCNHPGCGVLVHGSHCARHEQAARREVDRHRASASQRGYSNRWRKASTQYLREHPLCECDDCRAGSLRVMASRVVDHVIPHRLDQALASRDPAAIAAAQSLFWNRRNWRAMAKTCHDRKTAREDGGFGNVRRALTPGASENF